MKSRYTFISPTTKLTKSQICTKIHPYMLLHQNLKIPNYNRNLAKSEIGLILSQYQIFTHMVKNNIHALYSFFLKNNPRTLVK